jgi:thiamine-phosphate pyrophosphorylase
VRAAVRGLYAVTPDMLDTAWLARAVQAALSGGARLIQYRNKTASRELRLGQAQALAALCAQSGAIFIVNDDVEIARAVGADGVHVGSQDAPLATARAALGPGRLVGVSCYDRLSLARAAREGGADYIAFGSFFPSRVKPGAVRAPIELIAQAKREIALPVVAIGGITPENAPDLVAQGVDAVAVISAIFDAPDIAAAARAFAPLFEHPS